ncbi:MAG: SUMF1/EgtB/PvdO family nonheme iron enzyme [Robiginitomaculum sp.]|nr:SUMF1/EgtB/PvdO family nonheme iron enzyme [Robiginitomaculum sp.]
MADIFISYKREEADTAETLANTFEQLGFSVWWDVGLLAGDEFREVIREMIDKSKVVIVLWSPLAVLSKFVVDEATHAQRLDKLLPALLESCELPFGFGSHHADSLEEWDGQINHKGFSRLLQSVERKIEKKARFGGIQGSSPAQKAEMAAFQTVAKLDSKQAWIKFLCDYPGTSFRGFIETHIGETVAMDQKPAALKKPKSAPKPKPEAKVEDKKAAEPAPKKQKKSKQKKPKQKNTPVYPSQDLGGDKSNKGMLFGLAAVAAIALAAGGYFMFGKEPTTNPTPPRQQDRPIAATDNSAWQTATARNTLYSYENYLKANPRGANRNGALRKIAEIKQLVGTSDDEAFEKASQLGSAVAFGAYVRHYPNGKHIASADKSSWVSALGDNNRSSFQAYLTAFPNGKYQADANKKLGRAANSNPRPQAVLPPQAKDCANCPDMAIIPTGQFRMGDQQNGGDEDERPVRTVRITKSFSVSKYEITFDQWTACVKDAGCRYMPSDNDWGKGRQPVISVSWSDTLQYINWLNGITGKQYRLLSEAEWEYIARAGSATKYFWGNSVGSDRANCANCGSEWDEEQPAPVGSFAANKFGVYDMHGNVYEWVQDCWHKDYNGAPKTANVHRGGDCDYRMVRGGSFDISAKGMRSANRTKFKPGFRDTITGFRVARTD